MFSKKIMKEDLITLNTLKAQLNNCSELIREAFTELMNDSLDSSTIRKNKIYIQDLQDQYLDLQKQITILQEQIFFNYTNILHVQAKTYKPNFPHIEKFNWYKNNN